MRPNGFCRKILAEKFWYAPKFTTILFVMLETIHAIIAVLLIISITVQTRSSGLSATFGGSGAANVVQRRGAEKLIFQVSIWLSVVFFALTIVRWYVY